MDRRQHLFARMALSFVALFTAKCALVLGIDDGVERAEGDASANDASTQDVRVTNGALCDASAADTATAVADAHLDSATVSACFNCITAAAGGVCSASFMTCTSDPTCDSWLNCVEPCTTSACASSCDLMYSTASAKYQSVYSCACDNCAAECASVNDPCSHK